MKAICHPPSSTPSTLPSKGNITNNFDHQTILVSVEVGTAQPLGTLMEVAG
jgi:hypothetical protein